MSSHPTLVFVHGGWHSPACFSKVTASLATYGYSCHVPELPSTGALASTKTGEDDSMMIRKVVQECADSGEDVVMIAHSNGGFSACNALEGLCKADREIEGKHGGVVCIAMIAAFIPPVQGQGAFKEVPRMDTSWWIIDDKSNTFMPSNPQHLFYNNMSKEDADYWAAQLRPMHVPTAQNYYEAWRHVPIFYMICKNDNAQPLKLQAGMVQAARKEGGKVTTETVSASHSPFLSVPEKVVEWIRRVAGEEMAV